MADFPYTAECSPKMITLPGALTKNGDSDIVVWSGEQLMDFLVFDDLCEVTIRSRHTQCFSHYVPNWEV